MNNEGTQVTRARKMLSECKQSKSLFEMEPRVVACKDCKFYYLMIPDHLKGWVSGAAEEELDALKPHCHHPDCFKTEATRDPIEGEVKITTRIADCVELNANNDCSRFERKE